MDSTINDLEQARTQALENPVDEERGKELCGIARSFAIAGRVDKAQEVIQEAIQLIRQAAKDHPWKCSHQYVYAADELFRMNGDSRSIYALLIESQALLPLVDAHYAKRKEEIIAYLDELREDNSSSEAARETYAIEFLYHYGLLDSEDRAMYQKVVDGGGEMSRIEKELSHIKEPWRRSVAYLIVGRLFANAKNVTRAVEVMIKARKTAHLSKHYWVRDKSLLAVVDGFLQLSNDQDNHTTLNQAQDTAELIHDPWKRSRALCWIALSSRELDPERSQRIIQEVEDKWLPKINYSHRRGISLLLIAEAYVKFSSLEKAQPLGHILHWLKKRRRLRRATAMRKEAEHILMDYSLEDRKAAKNEFLEFISLAQR